MISLCNFCLQLRSQINLILSGISELHIKNKRCSRKILVSLVTTLPGTKKSPYLSMHKIHTGVPDPYHFRNPDTDPDPHQSHKSGPDPH
jgi:hypothetical protein